jgi:hypothetical protein
MTGPSDLPTPLGALRLSLSCGESSLGDPDSTAELPSGARVVQWRDVGGLMVDLLVTRYDSLALVPEGFPGCVCWGAEWRMHAWRGTTPSISISSLLPVGVGGVADGDERITMTEVVTGHWSLAVAGLDDTWYDAEDDQGHLPPSWREMFRESSASRDFAGVQSVERGMTWQLPGLESDESAKAYTTVAWCPAGDERAELAPFFAVDIRPPELLLAAGVHIFRPEDRWKRKLDARRERR